MSHFKIVSFDDDNNLRSCSVKDTAWYVEYKLNIPVYPVRHPSKLFVFNDLQLTRDWASSLSNNRGINWAIYQCKVEHPVSTVFRSRCVDSESLNYFWNHLRTKWDGINWSFEIEWNEWDVETAPKGTVLVDSVTLTQLVEIVPK